MRQLRIALTGPGGSGKTYMINQVKNRLENEGYSVAVLTSTMRDLTKIGYINNQDGNWQAQMASAILRQIRQRTLVGEQYDFVLSDRAMSCELGYTQVLLESDYGKIDMWSDNDDRRSFSNLLASRDMIRTLWEEDSLNYWDEVLFKELHPDHMPSADGAGRVEDNVWHLETQKAITDAYTMFWGNFMPKDRDEAAEELFRVCLQRFAEKNQVVRQ